MEVVGLMFEICFMLDKRVEEVEGEVNLMFGNYSDCLKKEGEEGEVEVSLSDFWPGFLEEKVE